MSMIATTTETTTASPELTVRQAAQRLGLTLSYVYSLVWCGKLPARKAGGVWLVPAAAVESRFKARALQNAA